MPCANETCPVSEGLEVCLFCGHPFCANHRAEQDGLPACTGCLKAAHAQKQARAALRVEGGVAPRPASHASSDSGSGVIQVQAPPPLPPAPTRSVSPLAAFAAAPAAAYLWWFLGWLGKRHELPGWLQPAGAVAGGLVVFVGVWVIAKSRLSPATPE